MTKKSGKTHKIGIHVTAKGAASMKMRKTTLEEQLAPVFKKMDMARLYRVSQGEIGVVPGFEDLPEEQTVWIAQHWYNLRRIKQAEIQVWIAIGISTIALIVSIFKG